MFDILRLGKPLSRVLTKDQKKKLLELLHRSARWRVQSILYRLAFGTNLRTLALLYGTDKWGGHWYAQHYEKHFAALRNKPLNVLEIGVGGYDNSKQGGGSLRMWRTYFPKSRIYGIDIYDKSPHNEKRIKTFKGSQIDEVFLTDVVNEIGQIDIVIDDGSHMNDHVIATFTFLFPRMAPVGIYVVEDVQTSYWKQFGGTSSTFATPTTIVGFFKHLIDGLNYVDFQLPDYQPNYYDKHIVGMHFYHNMIVIEKASEIEQPRTSRVTL